LTKEVFKKEIQYLRGVEGVQKHKGEHERSRDLRKKSAKKEVSLPKNCTRMEKGFLRPKKEKNWRRRRNQKGPHAFWSITGESPKGQPDEGR